MTESLSQAIALHQQGMLPQAREAYLAILAAEPANAEARHFLGMLEHLAGNAELGLSHLQASVTMAPNKGFFHVNLGNTLKDMRRPAEAEAARAEIAQLDAQRRYLETQLQHGSVSSPVDGVLATPKMKEEMSKNYSIPVAELKEKLPALLHRVEELHEFNPMLGHRGCRLGITYPEITEMQARAIFEVGSIEKYLS